MTHRTEAERTKTERKGTRRPGPAPGSGGKPPLPPDRKKRRVVLYVLPDTADKIAQAGGSVFLASLVERELAELTEG